MLLENDILKLRALEPYDLELLYDWENNTEIWEVGNTLIPYSKYILHQYIENSFRDLTELKQLRLIIELKKSVPYQPIGTVDLFDIDFINQRAAIGILIADQNARNKGYAHLVIGLMETYAQKHLNLAQIYCKISAENHISLSLFQSANYQITGKLLNWKKSANGMLDVFFLQHVF